MHLSVLRLDSRHSMSVRTQQECQCRALRVPTNLARSLSLSLSRTAGKNWSLEYQTIINDPEATYKRIQELTDDFVYAAKTYGKIIIAEHCSHNYTVKPFNAGGQAGGSKYICQGILFKFPKDRPPDGRTLCMYSGTTTPSIARANKAANGELRVCIVSYRIRASKSIQEPLLTHRALFIRD